MPEPSPNPYEITYRVEEDQTERVTLPFVVNGPLTFEDFRSAHGGIISAALLVPVMACVFLLVLTVSGKGNWKFSAITLGVVVCVILSSVQLWRLWLRVAFKKTVRTTSWTVTESVVVQHFANGNSLTIPFDCLVASSQSARIVNLVSELGGNAVPRAGFSSDIEWKWFLDRAKQGSKVESPEWHDAETLKAMTREEDTIHVDGPMTIEEAKLFATTVFSRLRSLSWTKVCFLIACALVAAFMFLTISRLVAGGEFLRALSILLPATMALGLFFMLRLFAKKYLENIGSGLLGWRIDDQGVRVFRKLGSGSFAWRAVESYEVEPNGILFESEGSMIIPRSGFRNEVDWDLACEMFRERANKPAQA